MTEIPNSELIALSEFRPGDVGVIRGLSNSDAYTQHLMELGFLAGASIRLIKYAPLGDPIHVEVAGAHISLRKSEARSVLVERQGNK